MNTTQDVDTSAVPAPVPERVRVLQEAARLVTGPRQQEYGDPAVNFQRIADLWTVQFSHLLAEGKRFQPHDAAMGLLQLKAARAVSTPGTDTMVDLAGYAAIAAELFGGAK